MAYFGFLDYIPEEHRAVKLGKEVETAGLEHLLVEEAKKIGYALIIKDTDTNCHGREEKYFLLGRLFFPSFIVSIENKPLNSYVYICNGKTISLLGFKERMEEYKKRVVARCES